MRNATFRDCQKIAPLAAKSDQGSDATFTAKHTATHTATYTATGVAASEAAVLAEESEEGGDDKTKGRKNLKSSVPEIHNGDEVSFNVSESKQDGV